MTTVSQLYGWDLTLKAEGVTPQQVRDVLSNLAKKWVFQLENGEERGYQHYQIRLSLIKKRRLPDLVKTLSGTCFRGAHVSPTSNAAFLGEKWSYVMKFETRIEGPWRSDDKSWHDRPRELDDIKDLYPWQKAIEDSCKEHKKNDREVNVVFDPVGEIGKTTLMKYLRWNKHATAIPPVQDYQDMCAMVMGKAVDKAYVFDVPRDIPTKRLDGFWKGIESVKNGYVFDKRHSFKDRQMSSPTIWVFTNSFPRLAAMSEDRWKIWLVDWNKKLVKYTPERCANITEFAKAEKVQQKTLEPPEPEDCDAPHPKLMRLTPT